MRKMKKFVALIAQNEKLRLRRIFPDRQGEASEKQGAYIWYATSNERSDNTAYLKKDK